MSSRHMDWLRQSKRDLEQARHSLAGGYYEWACFAAHQAAEKALKALRYSQGAEARGHVISGLISASVGPPPSQALEDAAKELDKHYIPARYPNSYPSGAPTEFYTKEEAERAIKSAQAIIAFCENNILR